MERIILHIDVNNAFLSWSAIDLLNSGFNRDIREEYAIIGGDESKRHGIVLAKSMKAKQKGIVTGEAIYNAKKKCSNLNIYPPNYHIYQEMSQRLFSLLQEFTPDIEVLSIDECFIDYGKIKSLYGDELKFSQQLKDLIKKELGFTVNIGIGNNKLCAKMASDFLKPDRVHTLYNNEIKDKMWPLPIDDLYGIGKKTSIKLNNINIKTIGDLANYDGNELYKYFKNQAFKMIETAKGIDNSEVISNSTDPKGISHAITLDHDLIKKEEIYNILQIIADKIAITLRKRNRYAYVIAVNIKDQYFNNYSHQTKLKNATNITSEIFKISKKLFDEMWDNRPIRLIGIRLDTLVTKDHYQLSLFENVIDREVTNKLEKTLDKLKEKYGYDIITVAALQKKNDKDK